MRVTDIIFSQHVQPIRLNRDHIFFPTPATLCGFGHASTNLNQVRASDRLQFKDTTILTSADCTTRVNNARAFNPTIYPGHICTLAGRGIGGCYGDSGSPLVANGGIVGVVSFGLPCAQGVPDILARVSHYLRWIDTTMSVNFRAWDIVDAREDLQPEFSYDLIWFSKTCHKILNNGVFNFYVQSQINVIFSTLLNFTPFRFFFWNFSGLQSLLTRTLFTNFLLNFSNFSLIFLIILTL